MAKPDDEYILSWRWGSRAPSDLNIRGVFYWNEKIIANLTPTDYKIHNASYKVRGRHGVNILRIKAESCDPNAMGFDIDDVTLVKKGEETYNYIINGGF